MKNGLLLFCVAGGYHYLEVTKPGIPDPPEQQMAQNLPVSALLVWEGFDSAFTEIADLFSVVYRRWCY